MAQLYKIVRYTKGAKNVEYQINTSEDRRLFVSSVGREILVILPPDGRLCSREVTTS